MGAEAASFAVPQELPLSPTQSLQTDGSGIAPRKPTRLFKSRRSGARGRALGGHIVLCTLFRGLKLRVIGVNRGLPPGVKVLLHGLQLLISQLQRGLAEQQVERWIR